ncbi:hypothetical protein PspLS_02298 [Pyricularia sp. CBS 133598]|nr:hypothetical protein PspLS_02298 [Pyricularia sp. CBS 133598]
MSESFDDPIVRRAYGLDRRWDINPERTPAVLRTNRRWTFRVRPNEVPSLDIYTAPITLASEAMPKGQMYQARELPDHAALKHDQRKIIYIDMLSFCDQIEVLREQGDVYQEFIDKQVYPAPIPKHGWVMMRKDWFTAQQAPWAVNK